MQPRCQATLHDAAITMRFAASRRKPARIYARGNIIWRQSCSHSNAICNHRSKKRIELRTQEPPLVAEHRVGTKRPQPQPPHTRGTFHRRLQPLYRVKRKVSFSGLLPTEHATFMQPFQCDLQPQLQETHNYAHRNHHLLQNNQTTAAATAAHSRYLSSLDAATLHAKRQGFVLRLPPHNKEHATFMQQIQCDLQPQLQETNRTTHTGTTTCCRTRRRGQILQRQQAKYADRSLH